MQAKNLAKDLKNGYKIGGIDLDRRFQRLWLMGCAISDE
jgi:hypothetical protein